MPERNPAQTEGADEGVDCGGGGGGSHRKCPFHHSMVDDGKAVPRRITSFPRFRWSPSSTSTRSDDSPPVAGHHRSLVTVANPKQKQTPTVAAAPAAAPAAFATPRQPKGKRIIRPRDLFNQRLTTNANPQEGLLLR
ncbi:hypothetical protein TYRP_015138 [Tyrophagus putrescentiae]|nr:hypothetical protein TYRP_015138 [Tyrophagus putrescentiae]